MAWRCRPFTSSDFDARTELDASLIWISFLLSAAGVSSGTLLGQHHCLDKRVMRFRTLCQTPLQFFFQTIGEDTPAYFVNR
jgi:hypothetical protein